MLSGIHVATSCRALHTVREVQREAIGLKGGQVIHTKFPKQECRKRRTMNARQCCFWSIGCLAHISETHLQPSNTIHYESVSHSPCLPLELFEFLQIGQRWPPMLYNVSSVVSSYQVKVLTWFKLCVVCCDHVQAPLGQLRSIVSLEDRNMEHSMQAILQFHVNKLLFCS